LEKLSEELETNRIEINENTIKEDLDVLSKWLKSQLEEPGDKIFFDDTIGSTIKRINKGKWEKQLAKMEK
jgi:hypothetical protein